MQIGKKCEQGGVTYILDKSRRYKGAFQRQGTKSVRGKNQRNRSGDCRQVG